MKANYKPRVKNIADRALFFGVLVIGGFGAMMLKTIPDSEGTRVWAPLFFAIFLQVVYAYCVMSLRLFRLREDRAGDSFYYLGLLFTLISLAHTLWSFGRSEEQDYDTSQIISGFGIALATTIVGLTLRLLAQQFHSDVLEVETEARNAMVEAAVALRSELYNAVSDLGTLRQSVRQVIEEGAAETSRVAMSSITEVAGKCTLEIESTCKEVADSCSKFKSSVDDIVRGAGSTADALSSVSTRISEIKMPDNVAEFFFGPTREQLLKMMTTLGQAAELQREQFARLNALATSAAGTVGAMDSTASQTKAVADKALNTIHLFGSELARISTEVSKLLKVLADAQASQEALVRQNALTSDATSKRMHETLNALGEAHGKAADSAVRSTQMLDEAITKHSVAIGTHLSRAEAARGKLVDELARMADVIADRLA